MYQNIPLIPLPAKLIPAEGVSRKNVPVQWQEDPAIWPEGFRLQILQDGIRIFSSDCAGRFYAEKALEQLRFSYPMGIPCMEIEDAPVCAYRSFHIDSARHYFPLEALKQLIDAAAACRFNRFHWHFSDDQGWRIESQVYPLLHEVGARRKGDHFGRIRSDDEEHHYYTRAEVRELVEYCAQRHIQIVPEVDVPGHVTAILAAYPHLSCRGKGVEVATGPGIFPDILCPGKEDTFAFLIPLLDELCELFPGSYFHLGGDETPKAQWIDCPHCRARMAAEKLTDTRQLQGWMTNRLASHLRNQGKRTVVWNEAALGNNLDTDIIVQLWNDDPKDPSLKALSREKDERGRPTSPNQGIGARLIRKGHDVLMSNMRAAYCDYPYAYVTMKNVYTGELLPQRCSDIPEASRHVLGGECLCWAEYIRDGNTLAYMAFPRYAAKAEALWTAPEQRHYRDFLHRLRRLYPFFRRILPGMAPPKCWTPDPLASAKEMLAFASQFSKSVKDGYADAQSQV